MKRLVCVNESGYAGQLTRGASYEVLGVDDGARQYRVENDTGRRRWYPAYCFGDTDVNVLLLASYTIDDEIRDPSADWVEVTITLSDGTRRWCAFTTPAHLATHGDPFVADAAAFRATYAISHVVVVSWLSEKVIDVMLRHLDANGILAECSLPL